MTHAAATKAFIPQEGGKVISVTLSPHHGMPGMVHSGAARAAVENMMRTLSIEWARFGITLCAVAAGQIDTEVLRTKYPKEVSDNVARTVPLGRLGTPEEMAWLIAFLASPAGDFFSGAVLTIDGARDNWFGSWPPAGASDAEGVPARRGAQAARVRGRGALHDGGRCLAATSAVGCGDDDDGAGTTTRPSPSPCGWRAPIASLLRDSEATIVDYCRRRALALTDPGKRPTAAQQAARAGRGRRADRPRERKARCRGDARRRGEPFRR